MHFIFKNEHCIFLFFHEKVPLGGLYFIGVKIIVCNYLNDSNIFFTNKFYLFASPMNREVA